MEQSYDIYKYFKNDGGVDQIPFVTIPESPYDKYDEYIVGVNRLDRLSNKYYNSPLYVNIILMANPEYMNETEIPSGTILRIPFPIGSVLQFIDFKMKEISLQ